MHYKNIKLVVEVGDLLMVKIGSVGYAAIIDNLENYPFAIIPANLLKVTVNKENDIKFVYYWLSSPRGKKAVLELASNTAQPALSLTKIKELMLRLPAQKIEQQKISEILTTVDEVIERTDQLIEKHKRIKQGLMQDLFHNGIDEGGQIRSEKTHKFKDSLSLGRIPEDWIISKFKTKVSFPTGQVDPRKEPYKSMVLIAPDHIEQGTGKIIAYQTADQQKAISGKYYVDAEAVIYSKIRPYLAKAALPGISCLCSADMYPLKAGSGLVNSFLFFTLLTERFTKFASSCSERSGFPKINRQELGQFDLLIPPIDEQERIVEILLGITEKIRQEELYLQKLIAIKHGFMEDLLSGTVQVNHLIKN